MLLSKFEADSENIIYANKIVRILSFGIVEGLPVLYAITDPINGTQGIRFHFKKVGASISDAEVQTYVATLPDKDNNIEWFVFGEEQGAQQFSQRGLQV